MSLINEALKRAREEAERRQAAAKGLPLASPRPIRDRARWLTLAVVVLAGALLISLAILVNMSAKLPATHALPEMSNPEVVPPAGSSLAVSEDSVPFESANPEGTVEGFSELPDHDASKPKAQEPEVDEPEVVKSSPSPQPRDEDHQASAVSHTSPPRDFESQSQPRVFVGQAQVRDGQLVDLEGIAWSESEPFALLNGQVVGVGEFIRSYRVAEIHQDRVILEQDDDTIVLHLN